MTRPNILFITADDHAPAALSCYRAAPVETPNLDRLAAGGARLDRCFCTNALCTPARATMLIGTYSHTSGIRTLDDTIRPHPPADPSQRPPGGRLPDGHVRQVAPGARRRERLRDELRCLQAELGDEPYVLRNLAQ